MILVIARFRPAPGRRADLVALLEQVQAASRADDGCLDYGYFSEVADPDAFVAVEEWRDEAALQAHLATPHVAKLVAAVPDLTDGLTVKAHTIARSDPVVPPRH